MIFHACKVDGTSLGEFSEEEFQAKIFAGALSPADYYWHEGMADWRPISEYRLLAKTQKISLAPPMRSTIRIDMDAVTTSDKPPPTRPQNLFSRLLQRIKSGN